ncbi:MAG: hypothetical protein RL368_2304 [Pseudomonadota bacterium]
MDIHFFSKQLPFILAFNLLGCASSLTYSQDVPKTDPPKTEALTLDLKDLNLDSLDLELVLDESGRVSTQRAFSSPRQAELYQVLVAEFAAQRGQYGLAVENFLKLATQTRNVQMAERATRIALFAKQYELATKAAGLWMSISPDSNDARQVVVGLLLRKGCTPEATGYLEAMLGSVKGEAETQLLEMITALLAQQKNQTCSVQLMEKLVEKRQNDPAVALAFARLLTNAGQHDRALEVLKKLTSRTPNHEAAVALSAHILTKQNKPEAAVEYLRKALQKYPDKKEWRVQYARVLAGAGRFEESLKQFQLLLAASPKQPELIHATGLIALQLKQSAVAKEHFTHLLKFADQRDAAQFYLGQIAELEKNSEQAIQWYQKQEVGGNNYLAAQARIASLFAEQGQLDKAVAHLHDVPVESSEDRATLSQVEAELLMEHKRFADALAIYNRALEKIPNDTTLLYMRGLLAEKMDDLVSMEKDLRKVLELDPKNVHALNALGYSLADRTTRYAEALDLIKQAIAQNPEDYYILDSMGWVLYRLGKYPEAIDYLRKSQLKKDDPETAAHLGEVLWVSGDKVAAKAVWNKALKNSPHNTPLLEVMKKFIP